MKPHCCLVACLAVLAFLPTAWAQTDILGRTHASTVTVTATESPDLIETVRDEARSAMNDAVMNVFHGFFASLRTALGISTDSTIDPLAIIESTLETALTARLEN